ncbi:hypothetical protein GCM10010919_29610 [Alishewanella longhuensis]|uniref:Lipoprotein n=1 Tax=Alishewanella longhuensis TaxID=1091037 RepID=A0ABQ3L1Y4_9ALTE|nr:hypothetical protein [Alishewanella longhuensis]GHG75438.1 hypothetical protein GCM10010919_29610 [Alishewanella longhuensis]
MKRVMKGILLVSLFSLSACSTHHTLSARAQIDQEYIKQVEAASRKASHSPRIYWVNPPVKKTPETDTPDN